MRSDVTSPESSPDASLENSRERMVTQQLIGRGIQDPLVIAAMRQVPREAFVDEFHRQYAYDDGPLPILEGQTISQPYVVALMIELLRLSPTDKVLEIGTGSGYAAAVLSRIAAEVFTVERVSSLVKYAQKNIDSLGYDNVRVKHGDGTLGWPEFAPYEAIIVAAGGPSVPSALKEQLSIGGRMIIPVGREQRAQRLVEVVKVDKGKTKEKKLSYVRFVPLIGKQAWQKERRRWTDFF
jgi:protein-L-isoaspartate(D-aspartate) O-methyltransferase